MYGIQPGIAGVQRVRSYPFTKTTDFDGRQFHKKNQKDVVALIPAEVSPDDFVYNGDPGTVDVARVQLFFEFTIIPYKPAEGEEVPEDAPSEPDTIEAAFVSYISPFAESRNAPLFMPAVREEKKNGRVVTAAKPRTGTKSSN